jgi:diadenosine tetraphosphate (Ap4A) HIT family hydrolase
LVQPECKISKEDVTDMIARGCPICERGFPLDTLVEFPNAWITGSSDAPLPGYACVVAKRHVVEPFELEENEQILFWGDCMRVARALSHLFQPSKMNYEIHGNTVPHLHMHIFPRSLGDPYQGGPITGAVRVHRTAADLAKISQALRELG